MTIFGSDKLNYQDGINAAIEVVKVWQITSPSAKLIDMLEALRDKNGTTNELLVPTKISSSTSSKKVQVGAELVSKKRWKALGQADDNEGPGEEDGPWAPGWNDRSGTPQTDTDSPLQERLFKVQRENGVLTGQPKG